MGVRGNGGSSNRLTSSGGTTVTYDANGNVTGFGSTTYTWNARNQLSATSAGAASFGYDALGRRISATVSGVTTPYLYDGQNELDEVSATGVRQRFYLNGKDADSRAAMYDDAGGAGWLFYHRNHQGSVLFTTQYTTTATTDGLIHDQYAYGAYGEAATTAPVTGNPIRYTGRYFDAETGLYYYRARYYSPQLGRFLQTDPIKSKDDADLYAYTGNDPLNESDPTGNCTGSHIENNDGTCASTGGNTTDLDGASKGLQYSRDVAKWGARVAAQLDPAAAALASILVTDLQKHLDSVEELGLKLSHWQAVGKAGELAAEEELTKQGYNIQATHLFVMTAIGLRITDIVANGGPHASPDTGFEVKVNKSTYTLKQQLKDESIRTKGGTVRSLFSPNFPYGSKVQYGTGVIWVFDW